MLSLEWIHTTNPLYQVPIWSGVIAVYAGIVVLVVGSISRRHPGTFRGISASILSPLGAIFGLTAIFMAEDVWTNEAAAMRAAKQESLALSQMWTLSDLLDPPLGQKVRDAITAYVHVTLKEEWPLLGPHYHPKHPAAIKADAALHEMALAFVDRLRDNARGNAAATALHQQLQNVHSGRLQRLVIAQSPISHIKVALMVTLGLALILAVAVVHSDGRRLLIGMTIGASAIVAVVLCSVVAFDNPYQESLSHFEVHDLFLMTLDTPGSTSPLTLK